MVRWTATLRARFCGQTKHAATVVMDAAIVDDVDRARQFQTAAVATRRVAAACSCQPRPQRLSMTTV